MTDASERYICPEIDRGNNMNEAVKRSNGEISCRDGDHGSDHSMRTI